MLNICVYDSVFCFFFLPHLAIAGPFLFLQVVILDVRVPCTPVARLNNHRACVNGIAWAPHSSCHICTAGNHDSSKCQRVRTLAPQECDSCCFQGSFVRLKQSALQMLFCIQLVSEHFSLTNDGVYQIQTWVCIPIGVGTSPPGVWVLRRRSTLLTVTGSLALPGITSLGPWVFHLHKGLPSQQFDLQFSFYYFSQRGYFSKICCLMQICY